MKTLLLIGMGPGGPEYLTLQAIDAIKRVDVFFMLEKEGRGKDELLEMRRAILNRCLGDKDYRVVTATSPPRRRADEDYKDVVQVWHDEKRALFERLIAEELGEGQCGALLLWGDPSIYDQTVSLAAALAERSAGALALEIVPGISSVQVLAARHKIPLNRVGESILVTTGRHVETCDPAEIGNAVVMLDANASFQRFRGQDMDVYWGAYLGCADEVLVSGPLDEVVESLLQTRTDSQGGKGLDHGHLSPAAQARRRRLTGVLRPRRRADQPMPSNHQGINSRKGASASPRASASTPHTRSRARARRRSAAPRSAGQSGSPM